MGRGRQKAKQTKVARELKYYSPNTDYNALQRELAGSEHSAADDRATPADDLDDNLDDESTAEGDADDDDEYADWSPGRGR